MFDKSKQSDVIPNSRVKFKQKINKIKQKEVIPSKLPLKAPQILENGLKIKLRKRDKKHTRKTGIAENNSNVNSHISNPELQHIPHNSPPEAENSNSKKKKKNKNNEIDIKNTADDEIDIKNCDIDKLDELILDVKKKKFDENLKNYDIEDILFCENIGDSKETKKIKKRKKCNDLHTENELENDQNKTKKKKKYENKSNDSDINGKAENNMDKQSATNVEDNKLKPKVKDDQERKDKSNDSDINGEAESNLDKQSATDIENTKLQTKVKHNQKRKDKSNESDINGEAENNLDKQSAKNIENTKLKTKVKHNQKRKDKSNDRDIDGEAENNLDKQSATNIEDTKLKTKVKHNHKRKDKSNDSDINGVAENNLDKQLATDIENTKLKTKVKHNQKRKDKSNDRDINGEAENNMDKQSLSNIEDNKLKPKVKHNQKRKDKSNESDINGEAENNLDKQSVTNIEDIKLKSNDTNGQNRKDKIRKILELGNRNYIKTSGNSLRDRMLERLKAAKFRYLNEKLYTSTGSEAQELFQSDPEAFQTYHEGYQQQLKKWPVNPLDLIIKKIEKMPASHVIADMGCGTAALAARVPHAVHSFDLVAGAAGVRACDMARTPLLAGSVDVAVYCLALMGTQLAQYLLEANRILKLGGTLLIAEVESRFTDAEAFARELSRLGFQLRQLERHRVFLLLELRKAGAPRRGRLPDLVLKPCLYKRR